VRKTDTGKIYTMKALEKKAILERHALEDLRSYKSRLQKLLHPFFVNLNYCFQTDDKLFFIMDYINGEDLFHYLQKEGKFCPGNHSILHSTYNSSERVRFYCAEIALGLEYLHNSGLVCTEFKPENILLNSDGS
jgi:serine/threonine protein kinase